MKDKGTYLTFEAHPPTKRLENDLIDINNIREEYNMDRPDKIRFYSSDWVDENVERRQAHL